MKYFFERTRFVLNGRKKNRTTLKGLEKTAQRRTKASETGQDGVDEERCRP